MAENSKKNNFDTTVKSLFEGMSGVLSTKTVVGEAVNIDDTIILPLVDVSFGMGAGARSGSEKESASGGAGVKMSPSAVLVIHGGTSKLVNIKNQDTITKVLDMIPDLVDKFKNNSQKEKNETGMTDQEIIDVAIKDASQE